MKDCIFCKIINRELPASFIYEDETCMAFLDIHPITEGHALVIPKHHQERFTQLNNEVAGHLFKVAHKILNAIEDSEIKSEGANLFLSDGTVAGQEVMHSHLHIAPTFKGDGQRVGFSHSDPEMFPRKRLDEIATKISKFINEQS
ncbi:MAG: HIT domain-containing protein [Bdellovibrionaceae bacterium]|nr:HIT domain-containing protein [Pseudobdellovibrionaceae bacterium]